MGGGDPGRKAKMTLDAGGKSVSEQSQATPGLQEPHLEKKMILGNLNLTGSEHMICEFQKQDELDYADRRKSMDEKNVSTALDNTADDIQEARRQWR